ncbi:LOB domain-containing protein 2 [Sesamum angolense]|uniref:LOB domain-containing protein 2 n=1 Tax=Sesamum angolense TaxID=2727404 RepID=A0AAE2BHV6_9LAMI|nr:LOB domain-containing protein 2 [Sesamum angolense]
MQRINCTSACASCKHQRKKCTEKCILAPFFPVEKTREFQAVHKVFGVSNVTKIIVNLKEEDRKRAVDSLVWEALCRQKDPVLGPYGEYRRLCEELRLYKSQYQQFHQVQAQGSLVYKAAAQELMGWNNNKVMSINDEGISNNNNTTNNFHSNGNNGVDFCPYGYSSHHIQDTEKLRAERANGSALILPQQHLANTFSQQYFVTSGVAKTLVMSKP